MQANLLQCMEQFKAVEKEMKTKAYSKEGLSQNVKQDPKEREREELCDFLAEQLDEIGRFLDPILKRISSENPSMRKQVEQVSQKVRQSIFARNCR